MAVERRRCFGCGTSNAVNNAVPRDLSGGLGEQRRPSTTHSAGSDIDSPPLSRVYAIDAG